MPSGDPVSRGQLRGQHSLSRADQVLNFRHLGLKPGGRVDCLAKLNCSVLLEIERWSLNLFKFVLDHVALEDAPALTV